MTETELSAEATARLRLADETRKRVQQCQHEINEALRTYLCDLVGEAYLTPDGRIAARVRLVDVSGKSLRPLA